MSSIARPRLLICTAAALAASWITFRVLDADAAPRRPAPLVDSTASELPDPALEALIDRLAADAAQAHSSR